MLRAQDNLATSKAEEAAFKRQLGQANERFDVGLSDKTDVLEAQASYDTACANRLIAEQRVDDALPGPGDPDQPRLQRHRGHAPHPASGAPAPNDAKAWVDTAVQQNLRLLARQLRGQRRRGNPPPAQGRAPADPRCRWPSTRRATTTPSASPHSAANPLVHYGKYVDERSTGLELNIPIYSGGLTSQVRESYQRLNQSEQSREGQRRQVVQDTRNLHRAVNTDVEQVQARRQAIISNQSSLEATEIGYQVGTRNIVGVLNAQRQLYAAVRDYNNSRYGYILDTLRLKQAAGTLSPG
ncbi:TolC family protein [Pseudomonas aeruginosa]|nr:TolC family protein [Pseudomonas aeruginosa]